MNRSPPNDQLEVVVDVEGGASSGETNQVSISGAGLQEASLARPITIGSTPPPFGIENFELTPENTGGSVDTQAGSHPYELTTSFGIVNAKATHRSA